MNAEHLARYMPAVAELLLGRPNRAKSSDAEWRYGRHGSLSIDLEAGTFFDHERGQGGGVLDLIGREQHCSRAQAMAWLVEHVDAAAEEHTGVKPSGAGRQKPKLGEMVATYGYHDEHGELLFQVVRFEPKDFRQRRPDPSARHGWDWRLGDVRRVLYRLPELVAADPSLPVFVCEGEKDVDRLRAQGLVATTCPQGAGKWRLADSQALTGREVVILPDHDRAGIQHAHEVAADLVTRAKVKLLELPVPDKGDVSDWLDDGHTPAQLLELGEQCEPYKPTKNGSEPPQAAEQKGNGETTGASKARARARKPETTIAAAMLELWRNSRPIEPGTVAASYLAARDCRLPHPGGDLRWHPALEHPCGHVGPVLLALMTHAVTCAPLSLHRTWITATGKAKVDLPRLYWRGLPQRHGVVRLWPDDAVTLGLLVGEGLETVLTAARGFTPAWACLDAWHLKTLPVLAGLDCLTIVADHDAPNPQTGIRAGEDAVINCARRWLAAGVEVRIWADRRVGVDFADYAQELVGSAAA